MIDHFEFLPFLVGFMVGVGGLLFWREKPRVVVKYPHPSNVQGLIYRDPNGMCYKYISKEVDCDKNEATLTPYPLQEGLPGME